MKNLILISIGFYLPLSLIAQNQPPKITNVVHTRQDQIIDISFDVLDEDNAQLEILCQIWSNNNILKYSPITPLNITGDVGYPIPRGPNKNIRIDLNNVPAGKIMIQITALDREPLNIQDVLSKVSKDSLLTHVVQLQGGRNSGNTTFYQFCRNYIKERFEMGYPTQLINTPHGLQNNINIIGNKWGIKNPAEIYIADAHYDSFGKSPGADDNASGVAAVLEIARILSAYTSEKSFRIIAFDLEEQGLIGSSVYVSSLKNTQDLVKGVINFEMIGYYSDIENSQDLPIGFDLLFPEAYNEVIKNKRRGDFITNVANTISSFLKTSFYTHAKTYVPDLKVISLEVPGNGSIAPDLTRSDHASFWRENIPALMITDGANFRNKNYHTIRDSAHYLNFDFMASVVKASMATLLTECGFVHGQSHEMYFDLGVKTVHSQIDRPLVYYNYDKIYILSGSIPIVELSIWGLDGHNHFNCFLNSKPLTSHIIAIPPLKPGIYLTSLRALNNHYHTKIYVNK